LNGAKHTSTAGTLGCRINREAFLAALITDSAVAAVVLYHRVTASRTVARFNVVHSQGFVFRASDGLRRRGQGGC
jgi:hypothetical protein